MPFSPLTEGEVGWSGGGEGGRVEGSKGKLFSYVTAVLIPEVMLVRRSL